MRSCDLSYKKDFLTLRENFVWRVDQTRMARIRDGWSALAGLLVVILTYNLANGSPEYSGKLPAFQEQKETGGQHDNVAPGRLLPQQPVPASSLETRTHQSALWQQLSLHPICFYAKDKRPGELVWMGMPVHVGALALVHKSGFVRCTSKEEYNSYWGCYHHPKLTRNPLNVVVTDLQGNVIFPQQKYIRNRGLWYYLPGTDPLHSRILMFSDFQSPLYLRTNQRLRIWYGEDLRGWQNHDNGGRVCVDVVGYVMPTFSA